jgi:REP element-mobilizing transposase RayT
MYYLITFACYGSRLHGDESGSVDPKHRIYGDPLVPANPRRVASEQRRQNQTTYRMDSAQRPVVLEGLRAACRERGWNLRAAHVRSNHLHIVVQADARPERVLHDLKSYASRELNLAGFDGPDRKRWARHGSTRWLGNEDNEHVAAAVRYVLEEQGEAMAVYDSRSCPPSRYEPRQDGATES